MINGLRLTLLVLISFLLFSAFQCEREVEPVKPSYEFAEKLVLSPFQKTYRLTDTVWLRFQNANKTLYDQLSGGGVNYDSAYLRIQLAYKKLYSTDSGVVTVLPLVESGFSPAFSATADYGNLVTLGTTCAAANYSFRVGLVPQKKGYYLLVPSAGLTDCPQKKQRQYVSFNWTFDLADCNRDVFQSLPSSAMPADKILIEQLLDKKQAFVIKVD